MNKKISDIQLLDILKTNYKDADSVKIENDNKVTRWLGIVESKLYGNEKPHKSAYVSDLTKRLISWQIPSIVDTLTNNQDLISVRPFTYADYAIAQQEEKVLTHQFLQTDNYYEFITDLVTEIVIKGTCFVKIGWEYKEELVECEEEVYIINPVTNTQEKVGSKIIKKLLPVVNRPVKEICNLEDIRVDPTCRGDLSQANFIIHTFETDLSTLKQDNRYKNLDLVEKQIDNIEYMITDTREDEIGGFRFKDTPRKKIRINEYWGKVDINNDGIAESIVCTWVNDIIIRLEENPFPDKELPFVRAVYTRKPHSIYGEGLPALTDKIQRIDSILHRGIFDDIRLANNGQIGVRKGFTDELNLRRMKQGLDFEFNTTMNDVYKSTYNGLNSSIFALLEKNMQTAESLTGIKAFYTGIGGNTLGNTAASVHALTNSAAKREMHIVRGIVESCIIPLLKKYSRYNQEFLTPQEVELITDMPYVKSLTPNTVFDIRINIESVETRATKAQQTGFVLQTMAPNMPQDVKLKLLSRYMKLIGELDLAKEIEDYKPEPNPLQEQLTQLELAKLQAEIKKLEAKAAEDLQDIELKAARAEVEKAKARTIHSDSDLKDLDFLKKESGIDHQQELEKQLLNKIKGVPNGQQYQETVRGINQVKKSGIESEKE